MHTILSIRAAHNSILTIVGSFPERLFIFWAWTWILSKDWGKKFSLKVCTNMNCSAYYALYHSCFSAINEKSSRSGRYFPGIYQHISEGISLPILSAIQRLRETPNDRGKNVSSLRETTNRLSDLQTVTILSQKTTVYWDKKK